MSTLPLAPDSDLPYYSEPVGYDTTVQEERCKQAEQIVLSESYL